MSLKQSFRKRNYEKIEYKYHGILSRTQTKPNYIKKTCTLHLCMKNGNWAGNDTKDEFIYQ